MGRNEEEFGKKIDDFGDLQVILRLPVFTRSIWLLTIFSIFKCQCKLEYYSSTIKEITGLIPFSLIIFIIISFIWRVIRKGPLAFFKQC